MADHLTTDSQEYRKVMGLFATGVTVLAVEANGTVAGMTANCLTSVSLDPLLVLVCVHKGSKIIGLLRETQGFALNILAEDQEDLCRFFANRWTHADPPAFNFVPWVGGPRLDNAIGAIGCEVHELLEGGDHWIVIGRVIGLHRSRELARPLLFYKGQYRQLGDPVLILASPVEEGVTAT